MELLLEVFGESIGGGYDIGCKFETTLDQSPLGPKAHQLKYKSLVGSFHGHAHNRLCQTTLLANYVTGLGIEDLEGCERFFSRSNSLAPLVRHASTFHRRQHIIEFIKHTDQFETSQTLSMLVFRLLSRSSSHVFLGKFLLSNYKQALQILQGRSALQQRMQDLGIEGPEVFHQWLDKERAYLHSLEKEPIQETLEMDYYVMSMFH